MNVKIWVPAVLGGMLCAVRPAGAFEGELRDAQVQIQTTRQGMTQAQHDQISAAIEAQAQAVAQLESQIGALQSQAQSLAGGIMGPQAGVSAAAGALEKNLNSVVQAVQNTATAIERLSYASGIGRDDTLLDPASRLQDQAMHILSDSQNATDQICVMVVDPLRQRKMYSDAQSLATSAPTLARDGIQLAQGGADLYNLVSGQSGGPIVDPHRHQRNLCDPSDIWPVQGAGNLGVLDHDRGLGAACWSSRDCQSQYCEGGVCKSLYGGSCGTDQDCAAGRSCSQDIHRCVSVGGNLTGLSHQSGLGSTCGSNYDCESPYRCTENVCKAPYGSACSYNNDCISGNCVADLHVCE